MDTPCEAESKSQMLRFAVVGMQCNIYGAAKTQGIIKR